VCVCGGCGGGAVAVVVFTSFRENELNQFSCNTSRTNSVDDNIFFGARVTSYRLID